MVLALHLFLVQVWPEPVQEFLQTPESPPPEVYGQQASVTTPVFWKYYQT
jgi:hypothetical protein